MGPPLVHYRSPEEDSARWDGFAFRPGDIVISTRSKSGTTWAQMMCALLIFQTTDFPAGLGQLSPWLDHLTEDREKVWARLAAQEHRRFIKTHTPLDGVPLDARATYIVVARHPLDAAVSLYHQSENIDRAKMRQLMGQPEPAEPPAPRPPLREWLLAWIDDESDPSQELDSLAGVMWHMSDAWARRHEPNVVLLHYDDLSNDLGGEMRKLAGRLGITVPPPVWPVLVEAAGFENMKAGADRFVPEADIFKDNAAFFRRGRSGAAPEVLTDQELAHYHERAQQMGPPDMLAWLNRPPQRARVTPGPGGMD